MKAKRIFLQVIIILFLVLLALISVSNTYAYWTSDVNYSSDANRKTINIGSWTILSDIELTIQDLETIAELMETSDEPIEMVYDNFTVTNGAEVFFENINYEGIPWDILGIGTVDRNSRRPTIGFVQVVDRSVDENNNPIHSILPPAPSEVEPYPEYSFFIANDVMNTATNNLTSIRLNYLVQMTTSEKVSNLSSISFYALRGLNAGNDEGVSYDPLVDRSFTVSISQDGLNWISLGNETPGSTTNNQAVFDFYNFDIPTNLENEDVYIRISFDGGSVFSKGNHYYSRLVIDDLQLNNP
ncbi:MAG: hypothetical protein WCY80_06560 [Candidatus Izemoplasmatales bacterium]